jgi:RimJ/RimL family protein N-acetyltransferase
LSRIEFPLETERLLIRPMQPDDAEDLWQMLAPPSTWEYIGPQAVRSLGDARTLVERKSAYHDRHGFSMWSVVERASGRAVGDCGLQLLEGGPEVELGYHMAPAVRGGGYATEAARACLDAGLERLDLERIVAVAWPENAASIRVMQKAGMTFAGRGRHYGHETVVYEARLERSRSTASARRSSGTVSEMRKKPSPFGP